MALVINLWGAPCAGKSTIAAWLYHQLKIKGMKVELVREYAAELIWENRNVSDIQYFVTAEQARRLYTCSAEIIITDSPPGLGAFYTHWNKSSYESALTELCYKLEEDDFNKRKHLHVLIEPGNFFSSEGRIHSKEESKKIQKKLKEWFRLKYNKNWDMIIDENKKEKLLNYLISNSFFVMESKNKNDF